MRNGALRAVPRTRTDSFTDSQDDGAPGRQLHPCPLDDEVAGSFMSKSASHENFLPSLVLPPVIRPASLPPNFTSPESLSIFTTELSCGNSKVLWNPRKGESATSTLISTSFTAAGRGTGVPPPGQ